MGWKLDSIYDPKVRRRVQEALAGADSLKQDIAKLIPGKRIRQSRRPLLNKLETEWLSQLDRHIGPGQAKAQAKRYKLGNGIWFKPDFTATVKLVGGFTQETAWEVKGPHAFRGGFENLKVAAHEWPEVRWILVWKENGLWREQQVLP